MRRYVVTLAVSFCSIILNSNAALYPTAVIGWGNNFHGQISVPDGLNQTNDLTKSVVGVSAGFAHSLAVTRDGRVVGWGRNDDGELNFPNGLTNVVMVAAADYHSEALKSDGTVIAWGFEPFAPPAIPPEATNIAKIAV